MIGSNSVSCAGFNREPDGDEMEPQVEDVFKLPSAPGAGGLLRRVDFFSWGRCCCAMRTAGLG